MPITIKLIHENHILLYTYQQPWIMVDLDQIRPAEQRYFDTTPYPKLHSIVDATNVGIPPAGILRGRFMPIIVHPKSGRVAVVGAPSIAKTLTDAIIRISRIQFNRFTYYRTIEEAIVFLDGVIAKERHHA